MLTFASSRTCVRVGRRQLATGTKRLNQQVSKTTPAPPPPPVTPPVVKPPTPNTTVIKTTTPPPPPPPAPKSRPFRKFFIRIGLLTTAVYAAGITLSLKNDTVYDHFVDYFPLGEELIEFTENYLINYNTDAAAQRRELPSFGDIIDRTVKVDKSGVKSSTIDAAELQRLEDAKLAIVKASTTSETGTTSADTNLPLLEFATDDETLAKAVGSLNDLIKSINARKPVHFSVVAEIRDTIQDLNDKLAAAGAAGAAAAAASAKVAASDASAAASASAAPDAVASQEKDVELTKAFIGQLEQEKAALEQKFAAVLAKEIEATKNNLFAQANNQIEAARAQQLQEFNRIIAEKIDSERSGKLAKLDDIFAKIATLQTAETELAKELDNFQLLKKLKVEISKIQSGLQDATAPVILDHQFEQLQQLAAATDDQVLIESVKQIPKSGNLLTKQQLITRWKLLVPELKSASLLPPNAGILGHFASRIFSKLLFSKEGVAHGNDIESIVARVNNYLERDELDLAVEQVASLRGWSRKLADDWVRESRKRLEVEFLVTLVDYEARLLA